MSLNPFVFARGDLCTAGGTGRDGNRAGRAWAAGGAETGWRQGRGRRVGTGTRAKAGPVVRLLYPGQFSGASNLNVKLIRET